ncbi:FeoA domain-containing protein [Sphaerochaeta sp. S2]|jgi:ferrous iron transport protein A|uniref:FeoA family protein n=1 Tax=Sphaerochaeta sp. S2 TaxID=2798868 RepID=UPI0018E924CA|nr:FeoA domain-containing protein [Sphaerochaeta sp. S2]MCK9348120.1 FeoA domain-containing protein [Sphaerochaeta sp.]MBJ2356058.1 FeoA domain-containing protein [Sphaerochaeta sp. S2]MDD4301678.1 FeoA domain-containing protein [Sphaerochaeta sp.]MDD4647272.1 FeoA domain-containing protein [Sphaerochaeta sp.]MDY0243197.1 FeoA domain-containing protein [Sphaerochaeta sp.]
MPLSFAQVGETRKIIGLHGEDAIKQHLLDLGFVAGEVIQVVGNSSQGIVLSIKGVRLALNRGLAHRINVA